MITGVLQSAGICPHTPRKSDSFLVLKKIYFLEFYSQETGAMFSVDHTNQLFAVKLFASSPALVPNLTPTTHTSIISRP